MTYGQKITELRKSKNMTQSQLGEVLCVSPQAVSKWEHDMAEPDLATIKKICDIFKISVDEFLDMETNYEKNVRVSGIGITEQQAKKLSTDVASSVATVIKSGKAAAPIGYCVSCGRAVTSDNFGCDSPQVLCKNCLEAKKQSERHAKEETDVANKILIRELRKKKRKSIVWGCIASVIVFLLNYFLLIDNEYIKEPVAPRIIYSVFMLYAIFAVVAELIIGDGPIEEILLWFIDKPIRMPGVIFSLDLDGLVFFIVVKIGLAILGFLLGVGMFLLGIAIGCVVAPFSFPFNICKLNKQIKKLKTE